MMEAELFSLQMNTEKQLISNAKPSPRILELLVTAPQRKMLEKRPVINLALVLDRSGSMQGEKLEYVCRAAAHVLDLLGEGDRAAVVAYDDQILLVAESTLITSASRNDLKGRVAALRSGGSTNLSEGWLRGCEQVSLHMDVEGQVNRVLLLTDGLANDGITDLEELAVHARELSDRGISTSTFGVGLGYNEYLLESMALQGSGSFYYISEPSDIPQIFSQEFEEISATTARDVEVELDLPAGVDAEVIGGVRCEKLDQKMRISIGSISGGQEQGIYLDLGLPVFTGNDALTFKAVVRAKGLEDQVLEASGVMEFQYAEGEVVDTAPVNQGVLERAAQVRIAYEASEALKMERKGQREQASYKMAAALQANQPYLAQDQVAYHRKLERNMLYGMQEEDRKSAHYSSYLSRRQRIDPIFNRRQGMMSNGELLGQMMADGQVRMHDSALLHSHPARLPRNFDFERIEGLLLGLAVGDSLGNSSESLTSTDRRQRFGEISDYLPNKFARNKTVGVPSDDTQMAFWMVEVLLAEDRLNPEALAQRFTREEIYGIGSSVKGFLRNFKDQGVPWQQAGVESAGNGALMRIAPVLLPHLKAPSSNLWADAALAGMVTHNDYASNAACVSFTAMLWDLLHMQTPPAPEWWVETYCRYAEELEGNTIYKSRMPGVFYQGPIWKFVQDEVRRALNENWTTEEASNRWGSGAYLLETVPNVIHILARYAHDPEQAVLRAVNDTRDNDTVAAIVGAAVGALHGKTALPERWLKGLLGRTNAHNDGHIFQLIDEARSKFWER